MRGPRRIRADSTAHGPVKARISSARTAAVGETVGLRFRTDALVLFDGATRRALAAEPQAGGFHG